jgi:iron complex transport system substrate-binding protein
MRGALFIMMMALSACAQAPPAATLVASANKPRHIVSLDYCADQFVLRLADRDQIRAVSPDAMREFSYMREAARGLAQVRSSAEDVIALNPDLVVRSYGGGHGVAGFFDHAGIPLAQLGYASDFAGVRTSIAEMAAAFGHPERGAALIAEMDARLAAAAAKPGATTALYMTPAGFTSGEGTLVHHMIAAAGLTNFETQPGWRPIPLERLAREQPDLIAAAFFGDKTVHPDGWSAARHPIARRQLTDRPAIMLEGAWTACGGWFLVEAVEAMAQTRRELDVSP